MCPISRTACDARGQMATGTDRPQLLLLLFFLLWCGGLRCGGGLGSRLSRFGASRRRGGATRSPCFAFRLGLFLRLLGLLDDDLVNADLRKTKRALVFLPAFFVFQDFDALAAGQNAPRPLQA